MGGTADHYRYVPHGRLGGYLTAMCIGFSGFFGSIFIYGPLLPLVFVWPWLFRRITEILASGWQTSVVALCEKVHGMKVVVSGDAIERHEKTLVLLNHRTRLDWLYFFSVVFHSRILNRQKITLKSMLKYIPGCGWAMQVAALIFLDRHWESDKSHIENILSYFVELESKPNILFFPEGTDLSDSNKIKSKRYARKNDLPEFDYVLQPRTKGFTFFVNTLRNISGINAVHDVTVAYPYNIPTNEISLLNGEFPREVHFHIKRYCIDELPENEEELAKWCQRKWAEKEERLRNFYSAPDPASRKFPSLKTPPYHPRSVVLWGSLVIWMIFNLFSAALLIFFPVARWYATAICLFYVSATLVLGEFTKMEMLLYDLMKRPRHLWGLKHHPTTGPSGDGGDVRKKPGNVYEKYLTKS